MEFRLTSDPIPVGEVTLADAAAGGFVVFEGRVRDHNDGQSVGALEYEAYPELAVAEGDRVLAEARERFPILAAAAVHRVGLLAVGDVAIRVEVAAAHRKEAFRACEWIVDAIKARVPVWKKEHYATGMTDWLNADSPTAQAVGEREYYQRQVRMPGFGAEGQRRLGESTVLVVGAGGLGSAVLPYLAAAGVGKLVVIDPDVVDGSNLHRQVLYSVRDLGRPKAQVAAERLSDLNPHIRVVPMVERLSADNAEGLVRAASLVVDGTDNFAAKFLLNDACAMTGVPLVQASLYQFEGQVHVFDPRDPGSGCLRCLWPETPPEGCIGTCAEVGVLGVVPGVLGSLQAAEAIKVLTGVGRPLTGELLLVDLLTAQTTRLRRGKRADCPTCGAGAKIVLRDRAGYEADAEADLSGYRLVDIREDDERAADPLPGAEAMPLSRFDAGRLERGRPTLLVCARGVRSGRLASELRAVGHDEVWSYPGGKAAMDLRPA